MDKFGGVVILNESGSAWPDVSLSATKGSHTQESYKMPLFREGRALELVVLSLREKASSDPGHTQPDHWFCPLQTSPPHPSPDELPLRSLTDPALAQVTKTYQEHSLLVFISPTLLAAPANQSLLRRFLLLASMEPHFPGFPTIK